MIFNNPYFVIVEALEVENGRVRMTRLRYSAQFSASCIEAFPSRLQPHPCRYSPVQVPWLISQLTMFYSLGSSAKVALVVILNTLGMLLALDLLSFLVKHGGLAIDHTVHLSISSIMTPFLTYSLTVGQ